MADPVAEPLHIGIPQRRSASEDAVAVGRFGGGQAGGGAAGGGRGREGGGGLVLVVWAPAVLASKQASAASAAERFMGSSGAGVECTVTALITPRYRAAPPCPRRSRALAASPRASRGPAIRRRRAHSAG